MEKQLFKEIALSEITPNPLNPRKNFSGPKFDELVASIRAKGVLEPVLVRPKDGGYELVAGERRFRASCQVAEGNGGMVTHSIPAMVRDLNDDDAFDVMCIENLQREDLTELEEAKSFKMFTDKYGPDSVPQLTERTGINQNYIRRRLLVLQLPKKVLQAWEKGDLKFGHLEQLCRLPDPKEVNEYFTRVTQWNGGYPVRKMKDDIDRQAIKMSCAKFSLEEAGCLTCMKNTETQKTMFDIGDMNEACCLSSVCFKKQTNDYLQANWKKTGYRKQYGTNGFRFSDDIGYNQYQEIYNKPKVRCAECENLITRIYLDGRVATGRACIGDIACLNKDKKRETAGNDSEIRKQQKISWHGEYFRERFYEEQLPVKLSSIQVDDDKILRITFFSLMKSNDALLPWFGEKYCGRHASDDPKYSWGDDYVETREIWRVIEDLPSAHLLAGLKEASINVVMQHQNLGGYAGSEMADSRRMIAEHIGISLQEEWRITEEYLQKKTKPEILAIAEKFKIFEDPAAQKFLYETLLKKRGKFDGCKKSELVRVFLESGIDLAGIVPEEILTDCNRKPH
jgi:ParB family transcriptional regulator, chromosome partitioning protein